MISEAKRNGSGYYDPTAYMAMMNVRKEGENKMEVYKGDIFYIEKGKTGEKSPAVVVSATEVIEETGCAQVAWLTNKEENSSSTHAKVMCMTPSVAICEKLSFAYLDRFGEYIRTCTEKEIQDIDNAMLATFGIERQNDNADCEEIRTLKKELEEKQREIEEMKVSAREKEIEEKEPDDQIEEAANRLQYEVNTKCSRELEKVQKYQEGYTQGIEAFRTGGTRIPDKENEPSGQKRRREEETGWKKQMYNKFMKGAGR